MRHRKNTFKIGRTGSHKRCMIANMLKSLIVNGRIETTVTKAKELRKAADKIVTLAKDNTLASKRLIISKLMIRYNPLTSKEARAVKAGDNEAYNDDRKVLNILCNEISIRFANRNGGYTRIIKTGNRVGDSAPLCLIEYLDSKVAVAPEKTA